MARPLADLRSLARVHTETCVRALAAIVTAGSTEAARVSAASVLLDRGWGKAAQPLTGEDGGELTIVIRRLADEDAMKTIEGKTVRIIDQTVKSGGNVP